MNIATIIILAVLVAAIGFAFCAVRKGKHKCSCSGCSGCSACASKQGK